jgi:hypothetical protein
MCAVGPSCVHSLCLREGGEAHQLSHPYNNEHASITPSLSLSTRLMATPLSAVVIFEAGRGWDGAQLNSGCRVDCGAVQRRALRAALRRRRTPIDTPTQRSSGTHKSRKRCWQQRRRLRALRVPEATNGHVTRCVCALDSRDAHHTKTNLV